MSNIKDVVIPEGWKICTTRELSNKLWIGLVTSMTKNYVPKGNLLIRNQDIKEGYIKTDNLINLDIKFANLHNSRKFKKGDIATVHTGDVGTSSVINDYFDGAHGFATINTRVNDKISNFFLTYFYNSPGFKNQILGVVTGDGRTNLNLKDFEHLLVSFPESLKEQQKIAEILSTVDEAIEKTDSLIEKYKKIKTGLMEDLFTKGIDVNTGKPHTKFKDSELGRIPESWKVEKLGKEGSFLKGGGFAKKDLEKKGEPCITYGEIYTKYDYVIKKIHSFISKKVAKGCVKVNSGDILFAGSGETVEDIGKNITYIGKNNFYAGGDVVIFRGNKNNNIFLSYLLCDEKILKQKRRLGQGSSVIHIYGKHLETLIIPKPKIEEQLLISEKLLGIDNKIEKEEIYKEKLMMIKKGLMSNLLTGKVRVEY